MTASVPYVSHYLDYPTFRQHDTILIQSCTGTGKTTCVAQHLLSEWVREGVNTKLLSIVTRTSLADQHSKSFSALGMKNYLDIKHGLCDVDCLVICLNSLEKLEAVDDDELKNYVVYIDEVTSLLEFTSDDLLDIVMKQVVVTLTRVIKHARKVILSDAMLTDGCLELIKSRDNDRCLQKV